MPLNDFYQALTVYGTVVALDPDNLCFSVQSRSKDVFETHVGPTTYYEVLTNVDGLWLDRVADPVDSDRAEDSVRYDLRKYIARDMTVCVRGIYQLHGDRRRFDARTVYLMHSVPGRYLFEETHWWLVQISLMSDRWLDLLFDARRSYQIDDFSRLYRTNLNITGAPTANNVQECATLSRLIYGLSSAYLLTGAERYHLAAKAGVDYQREAFRSLSHDGQRCVWAYGRRRTPEGEKLIVASENPDDLNTIPLYEQIYALAGLAQYYRITLDWEVLEDIRLTINSFQDYFWDDETTRGKDFPGLGGYFS
ncbi:MAG: AGE family epimerase/isomerase, partial [Nitrospira sp.]